MDEVSLNLWVLGFAVGASLLTSVLFGLVPAFHAAVLQRWREVALVTEVPAIGPVAPIIGPVTLFSKQ